MKSLKILITLASVLLITRAVESTTSSARDISTLGNEIVNESKITNPRKVCRAAYMCPGILLRDVAPQGSLTTGLHFPSTYASTLCDTNIRLLACISNVPGLYNVLCERERKIIYLIRGFTAEFCASRDRTELEALVTCANNPEVQIGIYGEEKSILGSFWTIEDINDDLNLNISREEIKAISRQLQCSALIRGISEAYHIATTKCGPVIEAPFKKLGKLVLSFLFRQSPYGSCPVLISRLFPEGIQVRQKRSLNDFTGEILGV